MMVVAAGSQESRAAVETLHHVEAQNTGVKRDGAVEIRDLQMHMADPHVGGRWSGGFGKGCHAGASTFVLCDKVNCKIIRPTGFRQGHPTENCFAHWKNTAVDWIAKAFRMDGITWERHANPWSVWTRLPVLPLLALAIWARVWIGAWCLIPILALIAWTWVNPRAFARPASTRSWASRAVMGERVWLARTRTRIPHHHAVWATVLSVAGVIGLAPLVWGLWILDAWAVVAGLELVIGAKLWFLDRMVWLFDDMARGHEEYSSWLR